MVEPVDDPWRERLMNGDERVLAEALSEYRDRLWRLIDFRLDRRLFGRVDADDVLQETYLAAAQRLRHYFDAQPISLFIWLRTIALQTLVDVHRRHLGTQKRSADREVPLFGDGVPDATSASIVAHLLDRMTSPSRAAMRAELAEQFERAFEVMDPIDKEVLAMRHFEELTNGETAEALGITQKAASIRYVRALRRMREIVRDIPGFPTEPRDE